MKGKFTKGITALARHCLSKDFSNKLNHSILTTIKSLKSKKQTYSKREKLSSIKLITY